MLATEPATVAPSPQVAEPAVNIAELAATLGISKRGARKNAAAGAYGPSEIEGQHVYRLERFVNTAARDAVIARREAQRRQAAVQALQEAWEPDGRCPWGLLDLTDAERATAEARRDFIIWVESCKRDHGLNTRMGVSKAYWFAIENPDCPFRSLLQGGKRNNNQIRTANFNNWLGKWRPYRRGPRDSSQYWALADRYDHRQRKREGDERYWNQIALLYEAPNQVALSDAWAAAVSKGEREGWGAFPSYKQVAYWYQRKSNRLAVEARRQGRKFLYNVVDAPATRDWSGVKSGDCWASDHHEFNVFVRIPAPGMPGYWLPVRPWITQFLDIASFHEVASIIRPMEADSDVIIDTWRTAVDDLGWCAAAIYFDNGKDYRSVGRGRRRSMDLDTDFAASVAQTLGVRTIFAQQHNPRAKPCELDFGITERKWERTWPTYCGHDKQHMDILWPALKREKLATFEGEQNPLRGCLINPHLVPTLEDFEAEYRRWRAEERETKPSDGIILDGKSPQQKWIDGLAALDRPHLDPETRLLAFLRPARVPVTVKPGGVVSCNLTGTPRGAVRYQSNALLPFLVSGEQVLVKLDVRDVSHAFVFRRVQEGSWQLIRCEGPHGACPSLAPIPALTGHDQVRVAQRANRARRKMIRAGIDANAQDAAFSEWRRVNLPQASDAEAAVVLGAGNLKEQVDRQTRQAREIKEVFAEAPDQYRHGFVAKGGATDE